MPSYCGSAALRGESGGNANEQGLDRNIEFSLTSGLGPAEAGGAAPELRDVAVEVEVAAAADLAKVLARVWRGGGSGGSEGAFEQALERTRDSAAELRDAAAAEMRHAAVCHRDMVSFRSRFEKIGRAHV